MSDFPFYDAAVFGEYDTVIAMLDNDPGMVNAVDKFGFTALHGVVAEDHVDMARLLITTCASF